MRSHHDLRGLGDHTSVTLLPVAALKLADRNARTHSAKQVRQIADSIAAFGFVNPILVDEHDRVLAGHGRLAGARLIGMTEVPVLRITHLGAAEKRAYALADNRIAELAGWDEALLAVELQELVALDTEFDVTVTGFDSADIDLKIQSLTPDDADDDVVPPPNPGPPLCAPGDVWTLGRHRLICGDARDAQVHDQLMAGETARLVLTDPPYNVPIAGHASGLGRTLHPDFAMAAGEMSAEAFTAFLAATLGEAARVSADGALHFVFMDWRHMRELLAASVSLYTEQKNLVVWSKTNAGMGSLYRSQHELVFVFKVGSAPHINNVALGAYGRHRSNVWTYPGLNSFGKGRDRHLARHPTVKPVRLLIDAIQDASHRDDLVLDPFGGSGSTLIAAERTGRRGRLIELDPGYCDGIVSRWQAVTGQTAIHVGSGQRFFERSAALREGGVA